jgi:glycosyltransferase involved in cell wall biosynthesis
LRIAVISPNIYPCVHGGGLETFNYYFIKELAAQGHTIWLFTYCDYDWSEDNIHCVKLWKGFPGGILLTLHLSIILNLVKLRDKIDILHIPYASNDDKAFPVLFGKKFFGLPYVLTIHGGMTLEWRFKMLHKLFYVNADAIIAVSERIKAEYEKRSGKKIKVIPPLLPFVESIFSKSELRKKYGFNESDTILLYLGSIWYMKGSDILLEAFISLGEDYIKSHNLKLIYVGESIKGEEDMINMLQRTVAEIKFGEYVKFLEPVAHERVPELYKLADIYIKPSLLEGSPVSLKEAMFNALPIIGSNVDGINTYITHGKNGILFEKGDSIDLKNKIIQLIEGNNLAHRLGIAAKNDYSTQYVFQNMISDHLKIYKEVLNLNHKSI